MVKKTTLASIVALVFLTHHAMADSWTQKANFGGSARHAATGFWVNGKGYIGTGGTFSSQKKDFWQYDPSTNTWTQKADFGGASRSGSVGFTIGTKGYIATGFSSSYQKDLWQYDPAANTWTQKNNLGGNGRHFAAAFELNGFGYVGTGNNGGAMKDFWQYNPSTDTWTQKANFGGSARSSAAGFSVSGKGYIGIGFGTSSALNDFWEYDPSGNTWTQKANFGGGARSDAVAFSLCTKGYIVAGVSSASIDKNDLWEYDPTADTWTQKASFSGSGREDAVGFSDGTYGYIGTGTNVFNEFSDFYQYTPDCIVLPIKLESFSATAAGKQINIDWVTASELNNDYFTVEKSIDGDNFEILTTVDGKGTSTIASHYEVTDIHPAAGVNYYRLKQTDFDGTYTYSDVISCVWPENDFMQVLSVNPNPVISSFTLTLNISDDDEVIVQLFDTRGRDVFHENIFAQQGIHQYDVDAPDLTNGVYVLNVHCKYGAHSEKLVKLDKEN